MSVKKTLLLSAATAVAVLGSTAVLAGGPDHMSAGRCGHNLRHGFYFGAGPSYSFGDIHAINTALANAVQDADLAARGWGGGVYAGWDTMATDNFALGAQLFLNFYDVKTDNDGAINIKTNLNYNWGFAFEPGYHPAHNVNLYGRVGLASGNIEVKNTGTGTSNTYNEFGWLVGMGSELALGHNVSARAQYTFYDYGKKINNNTNAEVTPRYGEVMLGVSYHL